MDIRREAPSEAKTGLIYCIVNIANGKKYIGQTVRSLQIRWDRHLKDAKYGSDLAIHRAIRKHGKDSFIINSLGDFPACDLDKWERHFILIHRSSTEESGYNLTTGGQIGCRASREVLQKISIGNKKPRSKETYAKVSAALKGRKLSENHIKKLCEAQKKRWLREGEREKHSASQKGRQMSPETRKKWEISMERLRATPEYRQKMRDNANKRWNSKKIQPLLDFGS